MQAVCSSSDLGSSVRSNQNTGMTRERCPSRDKRREAPSEECSLQAEEEDDLDKLLEQYERQAEADKAKVLSAKEEKSLTQMGMAELRENALAKPLSAQTKSVS